MAIQTSQHTFSLKSICQALVKGGLVSLDQAREILQKREFIQNKMEMVAAKETADGASGDGRPGPVAIIDALLSLDLKRADDPSRTLDDEAVFRALARHWNLPFRKIDPLKLDLNLVTTTIPKSFARKHLVLPISILDGCLTVAMANPFNLEIMEDVARASQLKVNTVVSTKSDIIKIIDEFFSFKRSISMAERQFTAPAVDLGNLEQVVRLKPGDDELASNNLHVVTAVNHIFSYGFDQRASDIHIEPKRETSVVRMRIDGVLHDIYRIPKNVHHAIVSRIKSLSRLNIAERRKPQDGRIKTDKGDVEVEIRVSIIPVAFGEKVVMRVMDPDILFQSLENLGFVDTDLIRFNRLIRMPHGVVLVTGPTGSGKSTTLYSALRDLSSPEINITTVEDPIEMIHEDFNQIAVQSKVGVTFGTILRNILRQDPDIIMIGEMRDLETAESAIQAALTGHLVLSTLHTNDAPSSITRLLDLGVPPFLIQATLVGIVAQRLLRKICKECKESFFMDAAELKRMGLGIGSEGPVRLYRGKGCQKCRGTGYYGRTGIYEVLPFSDSLKKLTTKEADQREMAVQARKEGMVSLRENAVRKVVEGVTTYQEVLRVTWEHK